MRARQHVAMMLAELGRDEEAAAEFRELLRLNPGDNQGNRYPLLHTLLDAEAYDELQELLDNPEYNEQSAEWSFTRALLAFSRDGNTPIRRQLEAAMKANRYVVPLLIGRAPMPPFAPPTFSPGGEDEAMIYVDLAAIEWQDTEGAIEWAEEVLDEMKKKRAKSQRASQGEEKAEIELAAKSQPRAAEGGCATYRRSDQHPHEASHSLEAAWGLERVPTRAEWYDPPRWMNPAPAIWWPSPPLNSGWRRKLACSGVCRSSARSFS